MQHVRSLPLLLGALEQLGQQAQGGRPYSAARKQSDAAAQASGTADDEPEPFCVLPDLDTISTLNPRLHEIILQHQALQK